MLRQLEMTNTAGAGPSVARRRCMISVVAAGILVIVALLAGAQPARAATTPFFVDFLGDQCVREADLRDAFGKGASLPRTCVENPCATNPLDRTILERNVFGRRVGQDEWQHYLARWDEVCTLDRPFGDAVALMPSPVEEAMDDLFIPFVLTETAEADEDEEDRPRFISTPDPFLFPDFDCTWCVRLPLGGTTSMTASGGPQEVRGDTGSPDDGDGIGGTGGGRGTSSENGGGQTPAPVPLPAGFVLLISGLAALSAARACTLGRDACHPALDA